MSRARTFIGLSLILLIIQSSYAWKPNNREKEVVCKSPECKARGQEYKNNMDDKFEPCDDFYAFTCGNWRNNNPGPKYVSERSLIDVLYVKFLDILGEILETYKHQPDDEISFRAVKKIFDMCNKSPEYPAKDAKDIAKEITKIGNVPSTRLWAMHLKYLQLSGVSAFFRFKYLGGQSPKGITPVIMFMEPTSAYGSIFHGDTWKPREKQAYTEFLFQIMKSLKLRESDVEIKAKIEKVFEFRRKFNVVINKHSNEKPDTFKGFSGTELDAWFLKTLRMQTRTQRIPWTGIVDELLKNVFPWPQKKVAIRRQQYFLDLMALLKTESEEVLASHIQIFFVEEHLKLKPSMYSLLEATSVEPNGLLRSIKEKVYTKSQACIDNHNMKEILEKLLYEKWFPTLNASIIHRISAKIKRAIENEIKGVKWLDTETRERTLWKYYSLEEWIGFPPWIHGEGTPKSRDKDEILAPEASLSIARNILYVHAPLLLPPLYSPTIPAVYNYAGIGTTLGHEMYHIIDDCGTYDVGQGPVAWWPPEMVKKCQSNKNLFIAVYNEVTNREYASHYNMNVTSDTSCSLLENYPDVMGLEAAYNAYKESASKDQSVCQTLPKFEGYSCDQMFYIAFANSYCGYYTKKAAKNHYTRRSDHSLDSIRINAAAAQMESFGTAFKCPLGSPMNPKEKVHLWK